jgi:hypothetical protein
MSTSIKTNTTTTAINAMVLASISYDAALQTVRNAYADGKLTREDARVMLAMAYVHHCPHYAAQRDAETGKPLHGTALTRKVARDIASITATDDGAAVRESIAVPKNVQAAAAALWALCAEYEGAAKLLATAVSIAKAGK